MTPELLTAILSVGTIIIVWFVTNVIKPYITGKWSGAIIVGIVVPVLSFIVVVVTGWVTGEANWLQLGIGLLAVFVNELLKQLKPKTQ